MQSLWLYVAAFVLNYCFAYFAIPQVISLGLRKRLFMERSAASAAFTPVYKMGGIAIFSAFFIIISVLNHWLNIDNWHFVVAISVLLFFTGIWQDLLKTKLSYRWLVEAGVIILVVCNRRLPIDSLGGLFGIFRLSQVAGGLLSSFIVWGFLHYFIKYEDRDCLLLALAGVLLCLLMPYFAFVRHSGYAVICLSLLGAFLALNRFGKKGRRVSLGHTGRALIGFLLGYLCLAFLNSSRTDGLVPAKIGSQAWKFLGIYALIWIPLMDEGRTWIVRRFSGQSTDYQHSCYHLLQGSGLSGKQSAGRICLLHLTVLSFSLVLGFRGIAADTLLITLCLLYSVFIWPCIYSIQLKVCRK